MVDEKEAIEIYRLLLDNGIPTWVTGGWGIDALLGEQSRLHKDLDVIMGSDHIYKTCGIMHSAGYTTKELWPENRPAEDSLGNKIDTAFILLDSHERALDVHAIYFDEHGNGIPAWDESGDFSFTKDDLGGSGRIGGHSVDCITVQCQIVCHSGYELPDYQLIDMKRLYELSNKIKSGVSEPGRPSQRRVIS